MAQRSSLTETNGFDGRSWLTVDEWNTYRRRCAVRYTRRLLKEVIARDGDKCKICGIDDGAPLQLAHIVPFKIGVVDWGLTPDWLDGAENLCLAHAQSCNDIAELTLQEIPHYLQVSGLDLNDSPAVASGLINLQFEADGTLSGFSFNA